MGNMLTCLRRGHWEIVKSEPSDPKVKLESFDETGRETPSKKNKDDSNSKNIKLYITIIF